MVGVDSDEVVLSYNEVLDDDSVPAPGDFAVTVNRAVTNVVSTPTVSSVTVSATDVVLTLPESTRASDTVAVTYTKGANPIRDNARNEAVSFTKTATSITAAASEPSLSSLSLTGMTISPEFRTWRYTYTANVTRTATSTTLTAPTIDSRARRQVTPADADPSTDGHQVTLSPGPNIITITVTAEDDNASRTYTVTVYRDAFAPLVSKATVDGDEIVLSFDETLDASSQPAAADFSVTKTLGATASGVGVDSATTSGTDVTLTLSESVRASDTVAVTYTKGADPIRDTADNELPSGTVTLTNITAAATDAALSALSLSGVALSPAFASGTTTYTAGVARTVTSTTVTATADADARARIEVAPADDDADTDGHQVTLSPGPNIVTVTVTAEDDNASRTYTVTVDRDATAPLLSSATVDGNEMVLGFDETLDNSLAPAPSDFVVTSTAGQGPTAVASGVGVNSLTVSGTDVTLTLATATVSGDIVSVTYIKGAAPIRDTADNEVAGFTATVTNLLTPSLSSATVDGDEIVLGFDETLDTSSQPAAADFTVTKTLGATASSVGVDSVTMSATDVTLTLASPVRASDTVAVTYTKGADPIRDIARNEVPSGTATLTNNTAAATDATLTALSFTGVPLTPAFAPGTTTYTSTVQSTVTSTTVTAIAADARAQVSITPAVDADPSTDGHQVALSLGLNVIAVTVTAEDAVTTATYTVTVDRDATAPSLSSATVDRDEIVLGFDETLDTSSQPAAADFSVTKTLGATTSSVGVDSVTMSATDVTLTLASPVRASDIVDVTYTAGANPIRDIARNEVPSGAATLTNNTAAATDATLTALSFTGVPLTPAFAPGTTTYTSTVQSTVTP